ncbi:hypothetical protein [uncultured Nonlabens sp.]|uniref:hypothetical protein n=1 Tax=uncultured Nonlabens sp. TaxID=859306 RepID=UPI002636159B|nr:hypothetical protein [uncultured Nonlabens sp.]
MKKLTLLLMILSSIAFAQNNNDSFPRYQLSVSYGPQYNNFVDYDQELVTAQDYIIPLEGFAGEDALLQKREVGTYFNVSFSIRIGGKNYLEVGHSRTLNQGTYNGIVFFPNGTEVSIRDFQLRHRNHFYKLGFKRYFNDNFSAHIGIGQLNDQRSVINIFPDAGTVQIAERNYENSNSAEGIAYLGLEYDVYSNGNFTFGVKSTAYAIITAGIELETFSFTPSLRFNF